MSGLMWFHGPKHSQVGNPASASGVAKIGSALPRVRVRAVIDLGNSRQKAFDDETFTQKNLQTAQSRAKKNLHTCVADSQLALTRLLIVAARRKESGMLPLFCYVLQQTHCNNCHLCACKRDCSGRSQNGWCCRSFSKGS